MSSSAFMIAAWFLLHGGKPWGTASWQKVDTAPNVSSSMRGVGLCLWAYVSTVLISPAFGSPWSGLRHTHEGDRLFEASPKPWSTAHSPTSTSTGRPEQSMGLGANAGI